jgi:hypothetical protein
MLSMVRAHGLDPGPTQRPLAAGLLAGLVASVPALAVWEGFGWLDALAGRGGTAMLAALVGAAALAVAGGLYGLTFRRAANDPLGGWLFGLGFGFLLWMLVPVVLLQWLPAVSQEGRPAFVGRPAMGLLLGALSWGAMLGALFPLLHRRLHGGLEDGAPPTGGGPDAAAMPELGRNPRNGRPG